MSNVITISPVPDEAELLQIAKQAHAQHLHVISNGKQTRLCSIVPNGWCKLAVLIKPQPEAA